MADSLAVTVFGGVGATRGGVPIDLGGRLQRSVLAILLTAHGTSIPANRLAHLVWDADPPSNPSAALQSYVSHLRRALEPGRSARERDVVLRSDRGGYSIHLPPDAVDAWRFEELVTAAATRTDPVEVVGDLRRALELWVGRPYAEYAGTGWAQTEAARYGELQALALEKLFGARLEIEPPALLVPDLEAAVTAAPLREERWRLLALALYRDNRQGDALGALRRAREMLVDELGLDPSPALRELEGQLLAQAPQLRLGSSSTTDPRAERIEPLLRAGNLVDREGELAQIGAMLRRVVNGQGGVLLIEGAAGIGKTRLLGEARRFAEANRRTVLTARASQLEQSFAFGVVRQLFEPLIVQRPELLTGAAQAARGVFDGLHVPNEQSDGVFAALHGLYSLAANAAASGPVLLAVDDLQWCDSGSLRFFSYLARRLEGLPIAVVSTLRTGPDADSQLVADLRHDPTTTTVRPWPLSESGVGNLVRQALGDQAQPVFIAACHRSTGGNPLLLRQLLGALVEDRVRPDAAHAEVVTAIGSRAVASLVLARLKQLHLDAVAVARAIAVLGDGALLPAIAQLAAVSELVAADAITALVRADLLRDEDPVGFVHPLIREAIYGDMPLVVQQNHHDRAARILDALGAVPQTVAAHLLQVPPRGEAWVCDVLRRAARVARDRGAPESATTYLRRALAEPPPEQLRPVFLLELGGAENLIDGRQAVAHLGQAYSLFAPRGEDRARLAPIYAQALVFAGDQGEAVRFCIDELGRFETGSDSYQALVALTRVAGFMHDVDRSQWTVIDADLAGLGPGARRLAAAKAWELAIACEQREQAIRLSHFALADDVLRPSDFGLFWIIAAYVLDMADVDLGDFWPRARDRALSEGSVMAMLSVNLWWARHAWRGGDLREAESLLAFANEQNEMWGSTIGGAYFDAFHISVKVERGDLPGARRVVERAKLLPSFGDGRRLVLQAEAGLLAAEGRYAEALELSDETAGLYDYVLNPLHRCWHEYRAAALLGLGRLDEAAETAAESVRRTRLWGAPRSIGTALMRYGRVPGPHSEEALREAIELLSPTTGLVWLARAQLALAKLLGPDCAEAQQLLTRARENADTSGANASRSASEELLAEGGFGPVKGQPRLSLFERRVAQLTVEGLDEREIAQSLLLTPNTVSRVLNEIHARVGSEENRALAEVLART